MLSPDTYVSGKDTRVEVVTVIPKVPTSFSQGREHGEKTQTHHLLIEGTRLSGKKASSRSGQDINNVTLEILSCELASQEDHTKRTEEPLKTVPLTKAGTSLTLIRTVTVIHQNTNI